MKHLISLALKYLRRQKLRTTLTYLCIVLAVFVFNLLAGGAAVVRNIAVKEAERNGKWEVCAGRLIAACTQNGMTEQEAIDRIRRHVTVAQYYLSGTQHLFIGSQKETPGLYSYVEYSINGGDTKNCSALAFLSAEGDADMMAESLTMYGAAAPVSQEGQKNLVWLPKEYEAQGFKAGDRFQLTVTPAVGRLDDSGEQIQALYRKYEKQINANPGKRLFAREWGDEPEDDDEDTGSILATNKLTSLTKEFGYENIEFSGVQRGVPYTVTLEVAGFSVRPWGYGDSVLVLPVSYENDIDLKAGLEEPNKGFFETSQFNSHDTDSFTQLRLVMSDRMPFDDEMELLYKDLGLPANDRDATLHPNEGITEMYHLDLLSLKFRGADAISMWFLPDGPVNGYSSRLGVLIGVLILAFVLWMLMRAVIDNAFEISVQERRAQFATLRIMGASRRQIAALVCFEAMFYVLAAVPVGMLGAHLCAKLTAHTLARLGIGTAYQPMPLLLLVFTLLAALAVFISAYSSSMWASRAYAPLEATKKAELRSTKKQNIFTRDLFGSDPEKKMQKKLEKQQARFEGHLKAPKKAKLNRTPFSFLRHYTVRNIRRTRRRFVLSVVTMAIGTALFFFGGTLGAFIRSEIGEIQSELLGSYDFNISFPDVDPDVIGLADETFAGNPHVRNLYFINYLEVLTAWTPGEISAFRAADSEAAAWLEAQPAAQQRFPGAIIREEAEGTECALSVKLVTRSEYDSVLKEVLGISYDEWVGRQGAEFLSKQEQAESASHIRYPEKITFSGMENYSPLTLAGSLVLTQAQRMALFPTSSTGYDGYGSADLLVPLDNAASVGVVQMNGVGRHLAVRFSVNSVEDYPAVRETVENYMREAGGNIMLGDNFAMGTGLALLVRAIVTICIVALLAVWLTGIFTMVNTVNTSVLNRADELMMLRTVGMAKKYVRRTVLMESMIFVATATLIGCVIGLAGTLWWVLLLDMENAYMMSALGHMLLMLAATLAVNLLIAAVAARPGLHALNKRMEEGAMLQ